MARYQGLVGLAFEHDLHRDRATQFFREFVDYGVFPIGAHADMHRGYAPNRRPEHVSVGLDYTTLAAVHAFTYAEGRWPELATLPCTNTPPPRARMGRKGPRRPGTGTRGPCASLLTRWPVTPTARSRAT